MKKWLNFILTVGLLLSCNACSYFASNTSIEETSVKEKAQPDNTSAETNDKSLAKIVAELHGVQLEQMKQKERLDRIESNLSLGLIPPSLSKVSEQESNPLYALDTKATAPLPTQKHKEELPINSNAKQLPAPSEVSLGDSQSQSAAEQFARAYRAFEVGRYGEALVHFTKLEDSNYESALYWQGMCWYELKEFRQSQAAFQKFIESKPSNQWTPKAMLYLGLAEKELGLTAKSFETMKNLITQFPEDEASKMAKFELDSRKF